MTDCTFYHVSNILLENKLKIKLEYEFLASDSLNQAQFLAKSYGKAASYSIKQWKDLHAKEELIQFINNAIERTK